MKDHPGLEDMLDRGLAKGVWGTKQRSQIQAANPEGIKKLVAQQFEFGKRTIAKGMIPILDPEVVRVVALSGGYDLAESNKRLAANEGMIASFSRTLREGLHVSQTDEEFTKTLGATLDAVNKASAT